MTAGRADARYGEGLAKRIGPATAELSLTTAAAFAR